MKPWQRRRTVVLNVVVLALGSAGLGWQVFRNLAYGDPYLWAPLVINALMVLMAAGLLAYVLRMPTE